MHKKMKMNEVKYKQVEDPEAIADTIGISAMMVQDMSGKLVHDYPFDFEQMSLPEGTTGRYLQYSQCSTRLSHQEVGLYPSGPPRREFLARTGESCY